MKLPYLILTTLLLSACEKFCDNDYRNQFEGTYSGERVSVYGYFTGSPAPYWGMQSDTATNYSVGVVKGQGDSTIVIIYPSGSNTETETIKISTEGRFRVFHTSISGYRYIEYSVAFINDTMSIYRFSGGGTEHISWEFKGTKQ